MKTALLIITCIAVFASAGCASREFEKSPCHDIMRLGSTDYSGLRPFEFAFEVKELYGSFFMTLSMTNKSLGAATAGLGLIPHHEFIITTDAPGCEHVWPQPEARLMPIRYYRLGDGETKTFTGSWGMENQEGLPVPPGEYLVHVILSVYEPESMNLVAFERVVVKHPNKRP